MAEMILPGVYITVRDEGLITAGGVSTGNIGVVGTSPGGDANKIYTFTSYTDAQASLNPAGAADPGSLLKSMELLFGNGASIIYAVKATDEKKESIQAALACLEKEIINIVLLAGFDASNLEMVNLLNSHIAATGKIKRERIAVVGCGPSSKVKDITKYTTNLANDSGRLIYVGPGITLKKRDPATNTETEETLSGAYTAAAFTGLLSSLPVQASPTNKILNISSLAQEFNSGELEELVQAKVVAVEKREGYRVVKGITTSSNSAWAQITTRRIVDKAIYGVRSCCNPYIGKLNNERVRGAMKATINGFLTRMVDEEALTGYSLEVTASRQQEIQGICAVTMTIQPTFSIDFISVTMYLQ